MASQASARASDRTVATNRRARHEYEILETVEAGLVLRGTEVKALRAGQVTFKDSYATVRNEEAWLVGCHISPYSHGSDANHDPERDRKLLLHRRRRSFRSRSGSWLASLPWLYGLMWHPTSHASSLRTVA